MMWTRRANGRIRHAFSGCAGNDTSRPPLCIDIEESGMADDQVFDLTRIMEGFLDEQMAQVDVMRELLKIAEEANINSGYERFRIGDHVYTLQELMEIQKLEEHEVLFPKT